jgi:hypothetical protein
VGQGDLLHRYVGVVEDAGVAIHQQVAVFQVMPIGILGTIHRFDNSSRRLPAFLDCTKIVRCLY